MGLSSKFTPSEFQRRKVDFIFMKKLCSALLLLAIASVACSNQPTNSPQTPGAPPAATNQVDDKRDPNAPHNAATEAMSYCIQCVDRTYDQQGVDKTKLDMLKASFDKTMFAISDMMTTKEQKSQAVRDSLEVAKKVIPSVPSLTGLDSSLEEVLKAIDTLPETEIQTPNDQPAPAKGQAPNAQPAPAKGQAPDAQPAPAKGQAPDAQPANSK